MLSEIRDHSLDPTANTCSWLIQMLSIFLCVAPFLPGCALESVQNESRSDTSPLGLSRVAVPATFARKSNSPSLISSEQRLPLNVIAYNVHLLPDIAAKVAGKRSEPEYRAKAIAEQLRRFDIIGICEAFDQQHSQTLIFNLLHDNPSKPFAFAIGPNRSGRHLIGSGLLFLSRFPIETTHTITFKQASRFITSGFRADGFAAKGVLHARIRIGDSPCSAIDCFLTHLESRSSNARSSQIVELSDFIAAHANRENPIIVFGDLNVTSDTVKVAEKYDEKSPYQLLRSKLVHNGRELVDVGTKFNHGQSGTSDALAMDGGRRIDYIFISSGKTDTNAYLDAKQVVNLPFLDTKVTEGSLSDHLAVACRVEFGYDENPMREHETR